jgi:predicted metal-dependent peptidase
MSNLPIVEADLNPSKPVCEAELQKKFDKAKIALMNKKNSVFLTTVLFSLKHVWTDKVKYSGTDGECIYMNPEYMDTLEKEEFMATLAHNAWRVALKHPTRQGIRDEQRFQNAGAHVTNNILMQEDYQLPDTSLADTQYAEKCTEEVYGLLPDSPKDNNNNNNSGSGSGNNDPFGNSVLKPGQGDPNGNGQAKAESPAQMKARDDAINDMLVRAATQAEMKNQAGSIPGDVKRHLEEMLNPKLDWRTILQNYMNAFAKDDFSWRKPNRRFFPDHFLPSAYSEAVGEIAFAVDTSGSVSQAEFQAFLTEMNSIKQNLDPEIMTIIDFDTRINNVTSLTRDQDISSVKFSGGGGTALEPVFEHYEKKKPVVLVVFSDLYCREIQKDPGYPVVWIVVNNPGAHVNFGTTIDYDTTDL